MTIGQVEEITREVVADILEVPAEMIKTAATLHELGIDSLDMAILARDLEDSFRIELDNVFDLDHTIERLTVRIHHTLTHE